MHANSRLAAAQAVVADIQANGGSAQAIAFDVTDAQASARRAARDLLQAGPIQVLVNNAGIHDDAVFPGMRAEQWKRVIDVSLNGFFHVTQPLAMPMARTRWGRIISISSVAAVMGNRGQVNYAAAKGALHGASKSLSLELASRGITVNVVAPGIVQSAMAEAAAGRQDHRAAGAGQAGRPARRGGRAGRLPGRARGRLHLGPGDLDQRRHGLSAAARFSAGTGRAAAP